MIQKNEDESHLGLFMKSVSPTPKYGEQVNWRNTEPTGRLKNRTYVIIEHKQRTKILYNVTGATASPQPLTTVFLS